MNLILEERILPAARAENESKLISVLSVVQTNADMPQTDLNRLLALLAARHACVSVLTFEEEHALDVARQAAMQQSKDVWLWTCSAGLRDGLVKDARPIPETEHPAAALYYLNTNAAMEGLFVFLDLAGHLRDEKVLRLLRDLVSREEEREKASVILVNASDQLPPVVAGTAARLELTFPGEEELTDIVRRTCQELLVKGIRLRVDLRKEDLDSIVKNLRGLTRRQARQAILEAVATDRTFDTNDIAGILRFKRQVLSRTGLLEFVEAPASMDDIGGLSKLKSWLDLRREALGESAREYGIQPPRGVLLLGVQGAGKSLAAKAVATAWRRPLLRMDVGAFYNRYVGETERNLRDALRQAEMMAPVILWIDEIEKAFASAGAQSADGGLSKRMFGALLTWMQEHRSAVFLIATANDIESLPPELLRKGRFDEIFFVDLPGPEAREMIFRIHLQRRSRDPADFDLPALVAASDGFSGAEIEQAIISALYSTFSVNSILSEKQIIEAMKTSPPLSVTMRERIAFLRQWAKDRCVPAE